MPAVNLREYIKSECEVDDEESLEQLDTILLWLEGKSFTKEFWSQLTKEQIVYMEGDALVVEDSFFTSYFHYQSVELDLRLILKSTADNVNLTDFSLYRVSFSGNHLELLQKAFKNELKKDYLNLEFSETSKPVKFSLSIRNFIFGSIKSTMNSASELMAFIGNKDFKEILDKHLSSLPPMPPSVEAEDIDSEQEESVFDPGDDEPELFK